MGRIYKIIGDPESYRHLWENREALDKYLKRLKELMEEDSAKEHIKKKPKASKQGNRTAP